MPRYALALEYNGAGFRGWQTQAHALNVQDAVVTALSRVADQAVEVTACGRTDAGVHALRQVVHFDSSAPRTPQEWAGGANSYLPKRVVVHWVQAVTADFHARFCAQRRYYLYRIHNARQRPAIYQGLRTWVYADLDVAAMHRSAQALVGEHDFTSFRSAGCQALSPVREIYNFSVHRCSSQLVEIQVCANAFLQHMVRIMSGALIAIGTGKQDEKWLAQLLALRDRKQAGITAAPDGLYFLGADYPKEYGLPERPSPKLL